MKKSDKYLIAGIITLYLGACVIHYGLGLMLLGGLLLLCSRKEYNKEKSL